MNKERQLSQAVPTQVVSKPVTSKPTISKQTPQKRTVQKRVYAPAFGLLAAAVGILAGGSPVPMVGLAVLFAGLYLLAERQGWLVGSAARDTWRDHGVTAFFSLLVVSFVFLTGGAKSPMPCALYLPVLLASLCYGMRLGLLSGFAMICVAAFLGTGGQVPSSFPALRIIAIGLSFPVVAVFGGALRAQMESRLLTLDNENQDLSDLLDMSQMMDSAVDLDMTLNLILLNVQEHSDCQVCAVYLKAADGRTLELRAASGLPQTGTLLPALAIEHARGPAWWVAEPVQDGVNLRAFYTAEADAERSKRNSLLFEIDTASKSFACLPLANVEGLLGMLYIGYQAPQALTEEGVHRIEQLATTAIFPLQRLLFQQDFRSLAYSDAMTGLDNFRQFEETLADELARAERYTRPLSVILLDIDHFKLFNDTRGHQAGDALLGQIGVVLRNALRSVDRPARYGGEEFVIICPETGAEEARLIAERIRRSVADTPFILPNQNSDMRTVSGSEPAHVTISIGCATFPADSGTARDLVKKADIALYAAKGAGRDAVLAYEDVMHVRAA
ncbi:MAG: GGDEF domain-containing protein [Janthinobacterium lividum]